MTLRISAAWVLERSELAEGREWLSRGLRRVSFPTLEARLHVPEWLPVLLALEDVVCALQLLSYVP